jgi:hypothetical protein
MAWHGMIDNIAIACDISCIQLHHSHALRLALLTSCYHGHHSPAPLPLMQPACVSPPHLCFVTIRCICMMCICMYMHGQVAVSMRGDYSDGEVSGTYITLLHCTALLRCCTADNWFSAKCSLYCQPPDDTAPTSTHPPTDPPTHPPVDFVSAFWSRDRTCHRVLRG